jgi:RimJ/RimL family protein N-acetyltransferase
MELYDKWHYYSILLQTDRVAENMTWIKPERVILEGRYCRLEPIDLKHSDRLYELHSLPDAEGRYRWIPNLPFPNRAAHDEWIANEIKCDDYVTFVIIDKKTGQIEGRQSFMRIFPEHGCCEIGYVIWGPAMIRTRIATEGLYLSAAYIFDKLHYRRFEWKCDNDNVKSKAAATRFGFQFEGIFRQHLIIKGVNRDTAWFAMIDSDWEKIKESYEKWLEPSNFDENGNQIKDLRSFR